MNGNRRWAVSGAELRALQDLRQVPAILKLVDFAEQHGWMVTEYHDGGTLADHPKRFAGNALQALRSFEPLVNSVHKIHERQAVHRDIRPANIFSSKNELVLGDFGIVFWADADHKRMTETYERVGSRDWMAPWANRGRRLADVNPTFDVFSLGKVLWAMISGQHELPYWYWNDDEYNLESLFPDDHAMYWVNTRILAHTVVEREAMCVRSASELALRVGAVIRLLENGGQRLTGRLKRSCRVCGIGSYQEAFGAKSRVVAMPSSEKVDRMTSAEAMYREQGARLSLRVQICDNCGHVELFHFPEGDTPPAAWGP
jgi:serine/threonine protein kinase